MPNDSTPNRPATATGFAGPTHFMFAKPVFNAPTVAKVLSLKLGQKLDYAEGDEEVDGEVDVTNRVHTQVGADHLAVCAWVDATTLKGWPPRRIIPWAFRDLQEALQQYPELAS